MLQNLLDIANISLPCRLKNRLSSFATKDQNSNRKGGEKEMRKTRNSNTFTVSDDDFRKSSWSKNNPKTCVAVAITGEGVAIRDSKDQSNITQFYSHEEWRAFIQGVKSGEFDLNL